METKKTLSLWRKNGYHIVYVWIGTEMKYFKFEPYVHLFGNLALWFCDRSVHILTFLYMSLHVKSL